MNTARSLFALVAIALLAACASTSRNDLTAGSAQKKAGRHVVDQAYVSAVERATRSSGVEVVWINPPTKIERDD